MDRWYILKASDMEVILYDLHSMRATPRGLEVWVWWSNRDRIVPEHSEEYDRILDLVRIDCSGRSHVVLETAHYRDGVQVWASRVATAPHRWRPGTYAEGIYGGICARQPLVLD